GFNLQEFDTMARHRLPVVSVIFNNNAWGMSLHGQQLLYGEHYDCVSKLPDIAYEKVAAALGCHMERVHALDELAPAL
ncbi:thiamine pyrophosphate-dependent enzyme, partial [Escherichia coli]|uniref:thiamine pyrophosphate-dependent enzyme n=1 Tax=Escherichia coli TaxID=562 RepID=UPI0021198A4B